MTQPTTTTATATGWVTFYRVRMPDGRVALVQKNDGATRTVITTRGATR